MAKVYVASSWSNTRQPSVVEALREARHEVYDFRNPKEDEYGFRWSEVDPDWQKWPPEEFRTALDHPVAEAGFRSDMTALDECDACVLVLPCGRSAHLELGYAVGRGKVTAVLFNGADTPELMYRMVTKICVSMEEVIALLGAVALAGAEVAANRFAPPSIHLIDALRAALEANGAIAKREGRR